MSNIKLHKTVWHIRPHGFRKCLRHLVCQDTGEFVPIMQDEDTFFVYGEHFDPQIEFTKIESFWRISGLHTMNGLLIDFGSFADALNALFWADKMFRWVDERLKDIIIQDEMEYIERRYFAYNPEKFSPCPGFPEKLAPIRERILSKNGHKRIDKSEVEAC